MLGTIGGVTTHPFLTTAQTRLAHLRALDQHLTALELATVALADVRREIPELEAAMAVYRRLSDEAATTANGATPATTQPRAARPAPGPKSAKSTRRVRRPRRAAEPPSFKEFALTHSLPHVAPPEALGNGAALGLTTDEPGQSLPTA